MKIFLGTIILLCSFQSFSQDAKHLSKANTLLINRYFDTLNVCTLYSQKRQKYLDSALLLTPENSYLWQQKAMPLFKQKKYEIGMVFLDSAVKHGQTNEWQEYRGFIKCIFQKNYNGAIADLQYVKSKNENGITMDHSFNFYIGLSYLQLNKFDSACSYLQKSIDYGERKSGHGHFLEYFYLGITKMEMEDYENAIMNFDKSIKIASRFSDAKYYKAASLNSLNKYNDALNLLNESLNDFNKGYTINEDNALYEDYPYQIKTRQIENFIKKMTEKAK